MLIALVVSGCVEQKPNIIYLMADDQNLGSVGCYGNPEVLTPNMDKIADKGILFNRHYNPYLPECTNTKQVPISAREI